MVLPALCGGDDPIDGGGEDLEGAVHALEFIRVQLLKQLSKLAEVEFAEALEQGHGLRCRGHDDLAAIPGLIVPTEEAELDETVRQAAGG